MSMDITRLRSSSEHYLIPVDDCFNAHILYLFLSPFFPIFFTTYSFPWNWTMVFRDSERALGVSSSRYFISLAI